MAVYAIGDIQGCYDELQRLLDKLRFDPAADRLWFVGDLVNRGLQSLQVLRFVKSLGDRAIAVLGNHDLHLLAVDAGIKTTKQADLQAILDAPDRRELIDWLRRRPLMHHDEELNFTLVHAGLSPAWTLETAWACAQSLQAVLSGEHYRDFLRVMYGDRPRSWSRLLFGQRRLRYICNAFTRIRYCTQRGALMLHEKGAPGSQAKNLLPWFAVPKRKNQDLRIVFGHWSTLGVYHVPGIYALDSGCVWGGALTALVLSAETPEFISIGCPGVRNPMDFL